MPPAPLPGPRPVDLVETMAFDPDEGLRRLERHLARMKASAAALGMTFDRHGARNELQAATFRLRAPAAVRLLLAPSGAVAVEIAPLPPPLPEPVLVTLVPLTVAPDDWRLVHPIVGRDLRDAAHAATGTAVVFVRSDGRVTEGSLGTVFVERDGGLLTPPLGDGLLPGVLRAELIDEGRAVERRLAACDLADGFLLGNALTGLFRAWLAVAPASREG